MSIPIFPVFINDGWYSQANIPGTVCDINHAVNVSLGVRGYFLHQSRFRAESLDLVRLAEDQK